MKDSVTEDDVIGSFYEGALDPDRWRQGLSQLAALAGGKSAVSLRHDIRPSGTTILDSYGQDPAAVQAYDAHFHGSDPLTAYWRRCAPPVGSWLSDWELFGSRGFASSEYYNDFLRRYDTHAVLANISLQTDECVASISVQRAPDQGNFTAECTRRLQRLSPHLTRAARMHFDMARIRSRGELASAVLAHITAPVLVVNAAAKLLLASRAAEERLYAARHLRQAGLGLVEAVHSPEQLTAAVRRATAAPSKGTYLHLRERSGANPIYACVSPLRPDAQLAAPWQEPLAVILLEQTNAKGGVEEVLRVLYGLTVAESRVAAQIAEGRSPSEVAELLHTSVWTTKTQLKFIFGKLGVRRQSELASLISRVRTLAGALPTQRA